ncbi:SdpI family protein [Candidatus Latescibacterota bacterium]
MSLFYYLPGAVLFLSIFFILEKIGPNNFVGIRIGKALWNEENWYKVHKFTGWCMLVASTITYMYLFMLYLSKQFIYPNWDIRGPYVAGFAIISIVGDGLIPIIYNAYMPDIHSKEETSYNFDPLKSNFAVTIYVWLCLIFIFLSVHLVLNMIEPNTSTGIRISTTLANNENWYKAHYFEGMATIIGSCVTMIILAIMKIFFRKSTAWYNNGLIYLLAFLIPLILSQFIALVYILFILKVT